MSLLSGFKVEGLTGDGVKVVQRDSGEERTLEAETIVLALGATPERSLVGDLKKEEIEFYIDLAINKYKVTNVELYFLQK